MKIKAIAGYHKVDSRNSSIAVSVFYNPNTAEELEIKTDDAEYPFSDSMAYSGDLVTREEATFIMDMPIDEAARSLWEAKKLEDSRERYHDMGLFVEGDTVEVYKGRKVPKGTVGKITRFWNYCNQYGKIVATYAILELADGTTAKTNENNCRLVK